MERALKRAKELDEHLKTTGEVVGPLHGLPMSLKDQIRIKGLECTMGKLYFETTVFRGQLTLFQDTLRG